MEIENKNESVQMDGYEQGLAEDEEWKDLTNPNKLWEDDPLFKNYHAISTKQKGVCGEYYVSGFMNHKGCDMNGEPESSDHDVIIDGYKTEVKFSLAHTKKQKGDKKIGYDCFIINHVATKKDFDRLLFMGINPLESCEQVNYKNSLALPRSRRRLFWFAKKDFVKYMNSGKNNVFNHQQTGKKGKNDDYMVTNIKAFANLDFVKGYDEW